MVVQTLAGTYLPLLPSLPCGVWPLSFYSALGSFKFLLFGLLGLVQAHRSLVGWGLLLLLQNNNPFQRLWL